MKPTWLLAVVVALAASISCARKTVAAEPPGIEPLKRQVIANAKLRLNAVFSGDRFPSVDFEQPPLIQAILGPYTIATTFYDADQNQVTSPSKPGRYGEIVQITAPDSLASKRFHTLFRQPQPAGREQIKVTGVELAKELGIDPAVATEQADFLRESIAASLRENFTRDSRAAALLAGLHETRPGAGKLRLRNSPAERDREWWSTLKQKTGNLQKLPHLLFLPDDYAKDDQKRWPLILFLHGAGERGDNLEMVKVHGPPKIVQTRKDFPFIVVSPQCRPNEWWSPIELLALLDDVCAKYRVDQDRIYLTGLSMGGFGTWQLAIRNPERFAAIAPICGGGDPDDVDPIRNLPTWIFHGGKDPLVPVKRSDEMADALKKTGGRVRYTVYPDAGHDSWTDTYANQNLYDWFLKQRRGQPAEPSATTNPN